jgi:hypothetical protein
VTPSATGNRPVSLGAFLSTDPAVAQPVIPAIISDIVEQLDRLCAPTDQQIPAGRALLWEPLHDVQNQQLVRQYWDLGDARGVFKAGSASPVEMMDRLRKNVELIWVRERSCTHGDLNATNVAIDPHGDGRPRAYVIDPGGVTADLDLRDLAYLEVTTLLFYSSGDEHRLLQACRGYYQTGQPKNEVEPPAGATPFVRNTMALVRAIRGHVSGQRDAALYPALVFDAALRQLLGLAIQPKRNKVLNPLHARHLASWVAEWAFQETPHLFPKEQTS